MEDTDNNISTKRWRIAGITVYTDVMIIAKKAMKILLSFQMNKKCCRELTLNLNDVTDNENKINTKQWHIAGITSF
jgi:hypothetical protein